jgi:DNA-binding CsgD family transcriptional regulator
MDGAADSPSHVRDGTAHGRLVGRDEDVGAVRRFVDDGARGGGALLLSGDPGVGKTALLDAAAAHARAVGVRVLRATGAQFEADVSFAGLHHLLYPLLDRLDGLARPHRIALGAAFGLAEAPPADRLVVSAAVLELLGHAARGGPLLLVVDDLPWLDSVSVAVLGFVARRVAGTRIAVLASARTGEEGPFGRTATAVHEIGPLSERASAQLLAQRYPALSPRVTRRLLDEAEGNPLALLELPVALARTPGRGTEPLPVTLPLTRRLQDVFAGRIRGLSADCRASLLLAVLDATGDLSVLDEVQATALDGAERAGLVTADRAAGRLVFRHPLIRSAVVGSSVSGERRRAHRLLAQRRAGDPARHAWHLAEAATGPDEHVAALLQEVAHGNLFRGDSVGAVRELLRSADLSPSGTGRSARLAEAAYLGATVTGDLGAVPALMDAARDADPRYGGSLAGAVAGAYHLLTGDGDVDGAHRLLVGAIEAHPGRADASDKTLVEALYTLLLVSFYGGRTELWTPFHAALDRLRPRPPRLLDILGATFADPARLALPALDDLDAAVLGLRHETSPARIVRTAIAASYVDRIGGCAEPLWRAVRHGREGGAVTSAIEALFLLGNDAYFTGRWDEVTPLVDEGLALCDEHGYRVMRWPGHFLHALVAAARGDHETSRALADEMARWATPRGAGAVTAYVAHVRTQDALARGDADGAFGHATSISPAGVLPRHAPQALWVIMDLVESAVRSGRRAEAATHVAAVDAAGIGALSPRLAFAVAAATAMAAPDDGYREAFERALAVPGAERRPFAAGRVHLAYGERLRRARSVAAAREHLGAALDAFERLRARPWVARTGHELRATGVHREPAGPGGLTAQQREIAELASAGLSNKEIGARLYLSARTVGNHLYQIFPKLGVTSRAALRDALSGSDAGEGRVRSRPADPTSEVGELPRLHDPVRRLQDQDAEQGPQPPRA